MGYFSTPSDDIPLSPDDYCAGKILGHFAPGTAGSTLVSYRDDSAISGASIIAVETYIECRMSRKVDSLIKHHMHMGISDEV